MKTLLLSLTAFAVLSGSALAQKPAATPRTIVTTEHTYKDAVITSYDGDGVNIRFPGGMALIPLDKVPVELRHELGIKSPADIAEEKKAATDATAKAEDAQKAADKVKRDAVFAKPAKPTQTQALGWWHLTEAAIFEKLGMPLSINNEGDKQTLVYDTTVNNRTEFEISKGVVVDGMYRSYFIYDPAKR